MLLVELTNLGRLLSEAEELHVICASDRDSVSNTLGVDTLNIRSVDSPGVSALRVVGLGALGLVVIVAKHTSLGEVSFSCFP